MTVDELLAKLDAEWGQISDELPELYQTLGYKFYWNHTAPNCWPAEEARGAIARKFERQNEIRAIQDTLRSEEKKGVTS